MLVAVPAAVHKLALAVLLTLFCRPCSPAAAAAEAARAGTKSNLRIAGFKSAAEAAAAADLGLHWRWCVCQLVIAQCSPPAGLPPAACSSCLQQLAMPHLIIPAWLPRWTCLPC
jgi:hypothetical protein